ncbi:MAG: SpoIID/LytB domain-containing protein [Deltaproteobacteria bacterium]|nr:MAG: SpoIID/LytB domain-containing protein [Deltaproteobacteria bacterium]
MHPASLHNLKARFWSTVVLILALSGCSGAPPRPAAEEVPPPARTETGRRTPVPVGPAPGPVAPGPSEVAGTRFIRVLVAEGPGRLTVSANSLRAWDPGGRPVAEGTGNVVLAAVGERIRFGNAKLLGSSIDVAGTPDLRIDGRGLGGRVRVVARKGRILAVAAVPLEAYVAAVVSREAPPGFHREALAAQAIAVRTYAAGSVRSPRDPEYDVAATVEDQVFEGTGDVLPVFREAAESTRGLMGWYGGEPARTVFHSTCGGKTESAEGAWGRDVPYLRGQECNDCLESPAYRWQYRMSAAEARRVAEAVGVRAGADVRFAVAGRTPTGRAARVRISSGGVERDIKAAEFRKAAGYARVRSLRMEIAPAGDGWLFTGRGYGHGVGMCQFGANGMARAGRGYREILARYYPGVTVAREAP